DVRAVREQAARHGQAERDHARAAADAAGSAEAVVDAEQAEQRAEAAVADARAQVHVQVGRWADNHSRLLSDAGCPAAPTALGSVAWRPGWVRRSMPQASPARKRSARCGQRPPPSA
ncbi:hypothetical protein JNW88_31930, partial [Micromonospora sp. ATA32]|nr:hypothetical protein [Micromonospora sp. ATA32]